MLWSSPFRAVNSKTKFSYIIVEFQDFQKSEGLTCQFSPGNPVDIRTEGKIPIHQIEPLSFLPTFVDRPIMFLASPT